MTIYGRFKRTISDAMQYNAYISGMKMTAKSQLRKKPLNWQEKGNARKKVLIKFIF